MTWETTATDAAGTMVDTFGTSATYFPQVGARASITVVFEREPFYVQTDEGQMLSFDARAFGKTSDLNDAEEGDEIEIDSVMYHFATVEPDGNGITELKLKKA